MSRPQFEVHIGTSESGDKCVAVLMNNAEIREIKAGVLVPAIGLSPEVALEMAAVLTECVEKIVGGPKKRSRRK